MSIHSVSVKNFRNLESQKVEFDPKFNFIYGKNGSGKSSLLEAIYFVSSAKSFRTRKYENITCASNSNHDHNSFIVFSELKDKTGSVNRIGLERGKGISLTKLNGRVINNASSLASILPTMILEPSSFNIIAAGPGERRRFLDWGVFHVEQKMSSVWSSYMLALKQRNSLLRHDKIDRQQLRVWSKDLSGYAEELDHYRSVYFSELAQELSVLLNQFGFNESLNIDYYRGWNQDLALMQVLENSEDKDIKNKHTGLGAHRSDIKFRVNRQYQANEYFSRGKQKLLVLVLFIAQLRLLKKMTNKNALLLLDDVSSEFDKSVLSSIFEYLNELNAQIICTSVLPPNSILASELQEKGKLFHVEQGSIVQIDPDNRPV